MGNFYQNPILYSIIITLWYTNIANWKITIFNGKTHYKSPFSIAMLVITSGYISMKSHEIPWNPMKSHEITIFPMDLGGPRGPLLVITRGYWGWS